MKTLILILIATFSLNAFAGEPMTEAEIKAFMEKVEKETRQDYWKRGFDNVSSRTEKYNNYDIDNYVIRERNMNYHEPLDDFQIAKLYRCHYSETCELFLIRVSNSYHSGWADYSHFIFLDTQEHQYDWFAHLVYGE